MTDLSVTAGQRCVITRSTAREFSNCSKTSWLYSLQDSSSSTNPEELLTLLTSTCADILDLVAPLRPKHSRLQPEPWLNKSTRAIRQRCRQAEQRWKRDKLLVSLYYLWDCLSEYQKAVKSAKTNYLSNIDNNNRQKQVLFRTINSVIWPHSFLPWGICWNMWGLSLLFYQWDF